jgi:hypothetical protein
VQSHYSPYLVCRQDTGCILNVGTNVVDLDKCPFLLLGADCLLLCLRQHGCPWLTPVVATLLIAGDCHLFPVTRVHATLFSACICPGMPPCQWREQGTGNIDIVIVVLS